MSQPFSALHWRRVNQRVRAPRSSHLKQKNNNNREFIERFRGLKALYKHIIMLIENLHEASSWKCLLHIFSSKCLHFGSPLRRSNDGPKTLWLKWTHCTWLLSGTLGFLCEHGRQCDLQEDIDCHQFCLILRIYNNPFVCAFLDICVYLFLHQVYCKYLDSCMKYKLTFIIIIMLMIISFTWF